MVRAPATTAAFATVAIGNELDRRRQGISARVSLFVLWLAQRKPQQQASALRLMPRARAAQRTESATPSVDFIARRGAILCTHSWPTTVGRGGRNNFPVVAAVARSTSGRCFTSQRRSSHQVCGVWSTRKVQPSSFWSSQRRRLRSSQPRIPRAPSSPARSLQLRALIASRSNRQLAALRQSAFLPRSPVDQFARAAVGQFR